MSVRPSENLPSICQCRRRDVTNPTCRSRECRRELGRPWRIRTKASRRLRSIASPSKIDHRRMTRDFAHCFFEKLFSRRNLVPWRRTGRMWQWNQIKNMTRTGFGKFFANHFLQVLTSDELRDCQSAHRDNQTRFQDFDLVVHPRRTIKNFVRCRDAISPAGGFTRKTPTYGCEINSRPDRCLIHFAESFEPPKESSTRGVCEWPLQGWLTRPGCLANDYHLAADGTAGNGRRLHSAAASATEQAGNVSI